MVLLSKQVSHLFQRRFGLIFLKEEKGVYNQQ